MRLSRKQLRSLVEAAMNEKFNYPNKNKDRVEQITKVIGETFHEMAKKKFAEGDAFNAISHIERLENKLQTLFDKNDKVILNQVGYEFMDDPKDYFAHLSNPDFHDNNLGDSLKSWMGNYGADIKAYPHIYALHKENV